MFYRASVSAISLRAGSSLHASGGTLHGISSGSIHGSYSSRTLDFDIAVLRASSSFALGASGIRAVALLSANSNPAAGVTAWVSGWGTTSVITTN